MPPTISSLLGNPFKKPNLYGMKFSRTINTITIVLCSIYPVLPRSSILGVMLVYIYSLWLDHNFLVGGTIYGLDANDVVLQHASKNKVHQNVKNNNRLSIEHALISNMDNDRIPFYCYPFTGWSTYTDNGNFQFKISHLWIYLKKHLLDHICFKMGTISFLLSCSVRLLLDVYENEDN